MDYLIYLPTGGYYNDILEGGSMENRVVQEAWDMDLKRNERSLTKRLLKYRIFPGFNTTQRQKNNNNKKQLVNSLNYFLKISYFRNLYQEGQSYPK